MAQDRAEKAVTYYLLGGEAQGLAVDLGDALRGGQGLGQAVRPGSPGRPVVFAGRLARFLPGERTHGTGSAINATWDQHLTRHKISASTLQLLHSSAQTTGAQSDRKRGVIKRTARQHDCTQLC